jgi:uncharacterized SAM-binding protein YcdF (DUF218 family)
VTFNYLLWHIAQPSQLILIAAVLAAVCWRRPIGRKLAAATVALLLLFGLSPIGSLLIAPLENRFEIPSDSSAVDGIIVLAGAEQVELSQFRSQPQTSEAGDRLTIFLTLANAHPEARLVHSGAFESQVARSLLLGAGISPSRIVFEDRARNTCESAAATRDLVAPTARERWLLVTSAAHLPRAVACFRAADWNVIPYPTDFRSGPVMFSYDVVGNLDRLDMATHEWLGLVYYRLRGYIDDLYPAPEPAMIQP